ncbi:N-methyl-L-tryptophan oxidase [Gulosibacter molinativorax]|uniref:FAD-dependent oxidoreductase n=2 Tax=Gulosibacter molinativorax TaxID=256821 RepID=A0ABT7C532_9MICO|nr:N-methyl-L-tryptophan oxidase [Gulosibacter molinativorax]MDJ1370213.1 FAD-dependent oxidoreductase [Gulosibacter molinativorax]QUY61626.1 Putative sarcosine oxidase [Gulosibacter molinativorax]
MSHVEQASVVIIGMGTVGSMVAWQLSQRAGGRVIGVEQHGIAHAYGAYAGESRLFRTAAYEGDHYTPLLMQSQRLWRELEQESGQDIYLQVGALTIAPSGSPKINSTLQAAERFSLPHEYLEGRELRNRFPQHDFDDDDVAVLDLGGGGLRPERAVLSATEAATQAGIEVWQHTTVVSIEEHHGRHLVSTTRGEILAEKIVLTAGPWGQQLLPELKSFTRVKSVPLTWFMPKQIEHFLPERFPVFVRDRGTTHLFGAPSLEGYAVKISRAAFPDWPLVDDVADIQKEHTRAELAETSQLATSYFPGLHPEPVRHSIHPDSYTADLTPIIDFSADGSRVIISGLSGRGFKFAPVLGSIAADLIHTGTSNLFEPERFSLAAHYRKLDH